jgi:hypothetical protein
LTIFGKKWRFSQKNQCYDKMFAYFSFGLSQKGHFLAKIFLKIITSVPGSGQDSQVNVFALPHRVEGAAEPLVRLPDLKDVRAVDEAALPPALDQQVGAVGHHLYM